MLAVTPGSNHKVAMSGRSRRGRGEKKHTVASDSTGDRNRGRVARAVTSDLDLCARHEDLGNTGAEVKSDLLNTSEVLRGDIVRIGHDDKEEGEEGEKAYLARGSI